MWAEECGVSARTDVHPECGVLCPGVDPMWGPVLRECCAVHKQPVREARGECVRTNGAYLSGWEGVSDECAGRGGVVDGCCGVLCARTAAVWVELLQYWHAADVHCGWGCSAVRRGG